MTASPAGTALGHVLHYSRCHVPTPLGIAAQRGWLAEELAGDGLELRAMRDADDPNIRRAHYDHKLSNSIRQGGSTPAIWARAIGGDTRVIGLTWTDEFQAIVALRDSGIRAPVDLRGRRLGVPRRIADDIIDFGRAQAMRGFHNALGIAAIDEAEVEFATVDIPVSILDDPASATRRRVGEAPRANALPPMAAALVRGEMDAIYVKGTAAAAVLDRIDAVVAVDLGRHPDPLVRANNGTPRPITIDGHLATTRPDLVARLLGRAVAAGAWAAKHRQEALTDLAEETGASPAALARGFSPRLHQQLRVDLDQRSIAALADYAAFLYRALFIPQPIDVRAWIDPRPLAAARRLRDQE